MEIELLKKATGSLAVLMLLAIVAKGLVQGAALPFPAVLVAQVLLDLILIVGALARLGQVPEAQRREVLLLLGTLVTVSHVTTAFALCSK